MMLEATFFSECRCAVLRGKACQMQARDRRAQGKRDSQKDYKDKKNQQDKEG